MSVPDPPIAVLAELTHRCPLQCPYCSNPLELERAAGELDTETWLRTLEEIAELGALQIHFSGGEPTVRKDLETLVAAAARAGLYGNLITSAVLLTEARVEALAEAGLDHVQISFQDTESGSADRIGGYDGGHEKKLAAARWVRATDLPLTLNMVVHRQNLERLPQMFELAMELDAHRIEIAHVQYYGWAYENRAALLPTRAQLEESITVIEAATKTYPGLAIDYVVPDYYARRPKACMGGWGQRFFNITPTGRVLPCHAAETITGLSFDNVRDKSLREIWESSEAFQKFRGVAWMPEPCRSCERREVDWGGCRCQAFAIIGDAAQTDPACELSPHHGVMAELAAEETAEAPPDFRYRRYANAPETAKLARPPAADRKTGADQAAT